MNPKDVQPATTAIVERFHSVLYPFPLERLLELLPELGWIVPFMERDEGGVKLSGPVSKGNVKLVFDVNLRTLGVRGVDPAEALTEFRSIRAFAVEKFGLGPEVQTHHTELRFVGSIDLGAKPTETPPEQLARWWSGHPRSDALANRLSDWLPGSPLGVYGLRVATRGIDANRTDWTELAVSPSSTSGSRFYNFDLIYRNHDQDLVLSVVERAKELVFTTAEELEKR